MNSHRAKCKALQICYPRFVEALDADITTLNHELYAEDLITRDAHNIGSADKIASSYEKKLTHDESKWDKLIEVLLGCNGGEIIAEKLTDKFKELSGETPPREGPPGDNIPPQQERNRGESPSRLNQSYVVVMLHALVCVG